MTFKVEYSNRISTSGKCPFAVIDAKVAALKEQGVEVIDLGVGDPKSPTPDFVINALTEAGRNHATSGYPQCYGDENFRNGCARYMKNRFGVELDIDTEICSNIGSGEAMFNFPLGFINAGDLVIVPTPSYPAYANGTLFAGGEVYFTPLLEENGFMIDYANIPQDVADRAKIIWINYPNAPTGTAASKEWLEGLVAWANKNNIIIAADEGCYIDIFFGDKPHSILEVAKEGVVAFYSLSKRNNMTGYRVGFVAGDANIISGFKKVKVKIDSGTPTFVQDVAVIAMDNMDHCVQMSNEYKEKSELIKSALTSIGLSESKSDCTFFLWQKAPEGMTGNELADKLLEQGLVALPGSALSKECDGVNPGADYIRIALVAELKDIQEAARRIREINLVAQAA